MGKTCNLLATFPGTNAGGSLNGRVLQNHEILLLIMYRKELQYQGHKVEMEARNRPPRT